MSNELAVVLQRAKITVDATMAWFCGEARQPHDFDFEVMREHLRDHQRTLHEVTEALRSRAPAPDGPIHTEDCNVTTGHRSADHRIHCDCVPAGPESGELRAAAEGVLKGFDDGIFVRSVATDADPAWAIKLLPYLQALSALQSALRVPAGHRWTPMTVADEYLAAEWPLRREAVTPVRDFVSWLTTQGWTLTIEQVPEARP